MARLFSSSPRLLLLAAVGLIPYSVMSATPASGYPSLVQLWTAWRQFEPPVIKNCVPDYSAAAMAEKALRLAAFQRQLAAIDTPQWSAAQIGDKKLVAAEMNGMDFDLRVLKPWARDPSFYANVYGEESDVPEHEGPSISPAIDLQRYEYPLSKAAQKQLTCLIGAIPTLLEQAKVNLRDSNARDLWLYGGRAFREQSSTLAAYAAGTLEMRTLAGTKHADMTGADPTLIESIGKARAATDAFRAWIEMEAPKKTGPSGVGKENYDWYARNVHLVSYAWDEQVTLLRSELSRARASLALEEFRNRNLPPLEPVNDPQAWRTMAAAKMQTLVDFLIDNRLVDDQPYFRAAMAAQLGAYTPPGERNFFTHGAARDPSALYSHEYHWIELARRQHEPNKSPIRAATPLYDMYDSRSEGLATAMEELLMDAGLYDNSPRGREVVWAMLANRAARGLASLYVQANEMTLEEAGRFHALWTPRGWSNPKSDLVAFEQLLYLRQPGYGTSYITGKLELDRLISEYSLQQEQKGKQFALPEFFRELNAAGIIPFSLITADMVGESLAVKQERGATAAAR
jgi:hypothetical protein